MFVDERVQFLTSDPLLSRSREFHQSSDKPVSILDGDSLSRSTSSTFICVFHSGELAASLLLKYEVVGAAEDATVSPLLKYDVVGTDVDATESLLLKYDVAGADIDATVPPLLKYDVAGAAVDATVSEIPDAMFS